MAEGYLSFSRVSFAIARTGMTRNILRGLDLKVAQGECVALVGPRGCGKSTLLRIAAGLEKATAGGPILEGREVNTTGPERILISGAPRLRLFLTGENQVRARVRQVFQRDMVRSVRDEWIRHHLRLAGAEAAARQRPRSMTPVMRRRVELACALAAAPKVLLLDDPFAAFEGEERSALQDSFLHLQSRLNNTVIFVTRDPTEAVLVADRVAVMTDGPGAAIGKLLQIDLVGPRDRNALLHDSRFLAYVEEVRQLIDLPPARQPLVNRSASQVADAAPVGAPVARAKTVRESAKQLEKTKLTLGFVPLLDCGPLAVAKEEGFFDGYGLDVTLSRESSWRTVRDKVSMGLLDAAQMPAAMTLAASFDAECKPLLTAFSFGLNGDGISVSPSLHQRMLHSPAADLSTALGAARALAVVVDETRREGQAPLVFGVVSEHSSHNYLLRYWMQAAGIDTERDVKLVVVPPAQMVGYLRNGLISGCCVGEPWNVAAEQEGAGRRIVCSYDIWNNHPEKVLGVTRAWAEAYPKTHQALLKALLDACWWMEREGRRDRVCEILAQGRYVNLPADVLAQAFDEPLSGYEKNIGISKSIAFHRHAANFPWRSHALWMLMQMRTWGQIDAATRHAEMLRIASEVYRPDIYRLAAQVRGVAAPQADFKREGEHSQSWWLNEGAQRMELGPDRFADGKIFDPAAAPVPIAVPLKAVATAAASSAMADATIAPLSQARFQA